MSAIVSATTSRSGRPSKRAAFISRGSILLRDATAAYVRKDYSEALELGYQAALRTAGAYIAASPVAKRRRLPSGAWAQLRLVDSAGEEWAHIFADYSSVRTRVLHGLDESVSPVLVGRLIEQVGAFLDAVEGGYPTLDAVA